MKLCPINCYIVSELLLILCFYCISDLSLCYYSISIFIFIFPFVCRCLCLRLAIIILAFSTLLFRIFDISIQFTLFSMLIVLTFVSMLLPHFFGTLYSWLSLYFLSILLFQPSFSSVAIDLPRTILNFYSNTISSPVDFHSIYRASSKF